MNQLTSAQIVIESEENGSIKKTVLNYDSILAAMLDLELFTKSGTNQNSKISLQYRLMDCDSAA